MNMRLEVKKLVNKYKTNNPFELMDHLGIHFMITPLVNNINGFYFEKYGEQIICINSNLIYENRIMVAAHELGHAILHRNLNIVYLSKNTLYFESKFEKQANSFAAELLLDDSIFNIYHGYSMEHISKCESVSQKLVEYKFENYYKK